MVIMETDFFISLIHPIQWTIANPVSADRQKKSLICVHYELVSWPVPLCVRQVARSTSFLSRHRDVIASFSFGAHLVQTEFCVNCFFGSIRRNISFKEL